MKKPLSYWTDLQKHYEDIIAKSTDKAHVKVTKEALKTVKSKIKEYETAKQNKSK